MRITIYMYLVAISILAGCGTAQQFISTTAVNKVVKAKNGSDMLLGNCTRSCLLQKPFSEWFGKNYNDYKVYSSQTDAIGKLFKKKHMTIFLGTWCGDSKREVPGMIKILQAASFDTSKLKIIFVDNSTSTYKQSPQHEERGRNIFRVPTILVYSGNKELGRIIEFPRVSLEQDLLAILNNNNYVPNYPAGNGFLENNNDMIIYNVTINIHESVHDQWMQWMQEKHIKDVLATGKFTSARMVKVLVEEEMGGITYSIQFTTDSKETLQKYYEEDAPRLREEGLKLFADKMLAFRTELELISDH